MKLIYAANQLDSWASTDLNGLDHQYPFFLTMIDSLALISY